jgi:G2/mitotic-specific cyclin 3/4
VKLPVSAHSDIPDYFEEEDEEEYYDAEGYTTARSIRSRGDNTTGGLTTFLEPRVTTRVLKELEAAKDYVLATRTEDDIDDEVWDTSMVAEYGDDIFEYMRKLEVSRLPTRSLVQD